MTKLGTLDSFTRFNEFMADPNATFHIVDQWYPPDFHFPLHNDRYSKISILLNGQVKEGYRKQEIYGQASSLVIKPQSAAHTNLFGPKGTRIVSILLQDRFWEQMNMQHQLSELRWFHHLQYTRASMKFIQEALSTTSLESLDEHFIELLAALQYTPPSTAIPPTWLQALYERLQDEWEAPPTVRALAEWVGVHPVYLARAFRKYYHCSIKDYVRQNRVKRVIAPLSSPTLSLAQIAFDAGYADQSHFTRQFKGEMGMSPGVFRRMLAG